MSLRTLFLISLITLGLVVITGCDRPAQRAQKMLEQGQYLEVMDKFPDTQFALRARALYAEKLLEENKYDEILADYSDTPAAYKARQAGAQKLFDEGNYNSLIEHYPNSSLAAQAETILSDSLYKAGAKDELLERFPRSARGKAVLEERATEAFEAAKKIKNKTDKMRALEAIQKDYRGAKVYKEVATMLRDLRNELRPKKK